MKEIIESHVFVYDPLAVGMGIIQLTYKNIVKRTNILCYASNITPDQLTTYEPNLVAVFRITKIK